MEVRSIGNPELTYFLKREPRTEGGAYEVDLERVFIDILHRANAFVPATAGAIFLDEPVARGERRGAQDLVLVACFADRQVRQVGLRVPTTRGIVAHVYRTGRAYLSARVEEDPLFWEGFEGGYRVDPKSLICAPLKLEGDVIGVLELSRGGSRHGFGSSDLEALQLFAQTISASVVNAVDAQRARELSKRDDLTGLFNDRYLHHALSSMVVEALADDLDCGLIFLDLDHFKSVNDVHGHLAGSRVLAEVGALLRQVLPGDALPARYGGDEFVVVLPGAGKQELFWVAETVRKNIESQVFLATPDPDDPLNYPALQIENVITCSLGLATLRGEVVGTRDPASLDPITAKGELIRIADASMYEAKRRGRNRTFASWVGRSRDASLAAQT